MDATTALALYGCKMERNQEIAKASIFLCYKSYIKVDICAQSKCKALSSTESIQSSFFLCCNDLQCHLNYILSRSNLS